MSWRATKDRCHAVASAPSCSGGGLLIFTVLLRNMSHIQSINLSKIFINEREVELKSGFTYTLVFIHSRKVLKLKSYRLSKTDKKSMEQYIVFNLNSILKFYTSKVQRKFRS